MVAAFYPGGTTLKAPQPNAGLLDEPRPGAPRQIGDDAVERVLALTLESRRNLTLCPKLASVIIKRFSTAAKAETALSGSPLPLVSRSCPPVASRMVPPGGAPAGP